MRRISYHTRSKKRFSTLLSMMVLLALLGTFVLPALAGAQAESDPQIRLSSSDAPPCPGEAGASCASISFKADLTHTASYVFDCSGTEVVGLSFLSLLVKAVFGIDIPFWLPLWDVLVLLFRVVGIELPPDIDEVPVQACSLFALGSTFRITDVTPGQVSRTIVEVSYLGWRQEDQFLFEAGHTYQLSLRAHGRDFRDALEANDWGTFDTFAEVTYQELDLLDDLCVNAIDFDLPYSGNLEFSGDHDWQRIQSPVKGTMVLMLDVPPEKDYQLQVWSDDCSAVWVLSQNGVGVDEQFVMPVDPVLYRIHVYGATPLDFGAWYSVSASWDLNDNQWEDAAPFDLPFDGNLEYSGDHDWQKITIPAAGATLVLDVPEGKNYELELWRDDVKSFIAESKNGLGMDEYIPIALPGSYRIHIYGANPASDFDPKAKYGVFSVVDSIPPASTATFSGVVGNAGWYRSSVEVALSALDDPGGAGVQRIEYGFNYTPWEPFNGPWIVYTAPFTISTEGHTYLEFRAIDYAGNVEPNQSQVIRIDTVAPQISSVVNPPAPNSYGWYNTDVMVGFTASDFQSGIASLTPLEVVLTNEGAGQSVTGVAIDNAGNSASLTVAPIHIDKTAPLVDILSPQPTAYLRSDSLQLAWNVVDNLSGVQTLSARLDGQPVENGQAIDLYSLSLGEHTLRLLATDKADNAASLAVTFEVTADIHSLQATASYAFAMGWIEKEGVLASLNASLKAASASIARQQWNAARSQLIAFLNKLEAQKGKAVQLQAYELLRGDGIYVLEHLPGWAR